MFGFRRKHRDPLLRSRSAWSDGREPTASRRGKSVASGGVATDTGPHHPDCQCQECWEDREYDNEVMWGLFEARGHIDH